MAIAFPVLVMKYLFFFLSAILSYFPSCDNGVARFCFTVKKPLDIFYVLN